MPTYVYLLRQLVVRDVSVRYRGSMLGGVWAFAAPLIMLAVYTFVFSMVFQVRWGDGEAINKTDFALNLFIGVLLHGLLAETLNRAPGILLQHASYVKKIIFPLWLLPVVVVVSALLFALIGFVIFVLAFVWLQGIPPYTALFFPVMILPLVLFALGAGWFLAALGVYVRDVSQLMPLLVTILMFMAPIFYPVTAVPEAYRDWLYLNPLTYAVQSCRDLFFAGVLPGLIGYLKYLGGAILVAVLGLVFFRKVRWGFADVL